MSLLETQNFLARIYTDAQLRREFFAAPDEIGKKNDLTEKEIGEIGGIFPDEINRFAESLVLKRLREVEKLLPLTRQTLAENYAELFREFAPTFNSPSAKKHLADALRFGAFLQTRETISAAARRAAKYECAKLEFYAAHKNPVVRFFDFDPLTGARRKHFKVWLRIGEKESSFSIPPVSG